MKAVAAGAGLAGCEAAWQLANEGVEVTLCDIKPAAKTPAHHSEKFGELVCSNSLKSNEITNASGLLKEEMRRLNSLIIACADITKIPAGGALAVDREAFSELITEKIKSHPNIKIAAEEIKDIPKADAVIIATGPLTTEALSNSIAKKMGSDNLYFFDAAAPIVTFESIDMSKAFFASRYDKGTPDYVNCPMGKEEYKAFYEALINAEGAELKEFDKKALKVFEGCMPVEVMAKRGEKTLIFGPLKPVGLRNPLTGKEAYAVVQLRKDNKEGTLYNLVGFQTNLKFCEQKRVFSLVPALKNAEFVRHGVMHRNTFIYSPHILNEYYQCRDIQNLFFAGQITGVEGYVESASSGLVAGLNAAKFLKGKPLIDFPKETAIGALAHYISDESIKVFQPMNINYSLIARVKIRDKKLKAQSIADRSLKIIGGLKDDDNR